MIFGQSKSVEAFNKGIKLAKAGKYLEAIAETKKSVELDPKFADAHYNLGEFYTKTDQKDLAISHYRKYLELNPDATDKDGVKQRIVKLEGNEDTLYYNKGLDFMKEGKLDDAVDQFLKVVKVNPNHAAARNSLAACYQEKGQVDDALKEFKEVLRISPDYPQIHYNLGNVHVIKGDLDGAVGEYAKAVEISPDDADIRYNLGNVYYSKGMLSEAQEQFKKILRLNPNDADAKGMIDQISKGLKKGLGAAEEAIRGTMRDQKSAKELFTEEYIEELKAAITPADMDKRIELSNLYVSLKKFEEATVPLKEILSVHPEYADINYKLAKLYVNIGRMEEAVSYFKLALAINPNFLEGHKALAALYVNMGETDLASHELEIIKGLEKKKK